MGISTFSGKFDFKMRNLPNLKRKILLFEMGVYQNSRFNPFITAIMGRVKKKYLTVFFLSTGSI